MGGQPDRYVGGQYQPQYPGAPQGGQQQQRQWSPAETGFGGPARPGDPQGQYNFGQMGTQNQYANMRAAEIAGLPISQEMKNTLVDYRYMDQLRPQAEGMPNPADYFNPNAGGAQGQLGNIFGGQGLYQGPQNNPFMQMGQQMMGQMGMQGPQMPNAPNIQGAPTSYDPTMQFGGPQTSQFDPNQVQGPNMPGMTGAKGSYGGPQTGGPGFNELVQMGQQLGPQNIDREQMGQVGLGGSQLSDQAFQSALAANQALATSNVDSSGLAQSLKDAQAQSFQEAARAGLQAAGGRGFSDTGGAVAGGEMGGRLGAVALQGSAQTQQALMDAQAQQAQQRATGAGQLAGLGGTAAGALQGQQGLQLGQQQGLNQAALQQRGQDINQAQMGGGAEGVRSMADLLRATSGANIGAFQAGTERGLGQGGLDLQGQQLAQQGALGAYGAQTDRMGTQGNIWNQGQQAQNQAYGLGTERGMGQGQLGLGYNQLGSQNQNMYNQQMLDRYGQMGQQAMGGYGAQTDRFGAMMGGAQGMGGMYQQGQMGAGQQQLQAGQLANQILQGGAQGQQAFNQMQMAAAQGDQQALMQMTELYRKGEIQKYLGRKQAEGAAWGGIGQGLGGAAGEWAGAGFPGF
jgi:hypothetical protein